MERYPPSGAGDQRPVLAKIINQWGVACPNRVFARGTATYLYVFGYPLEYAEWRFTSACNGHVCHGDELPYVFQSAWNNLTGIGQRISFDIATAWTNFGKSGDPNRPIQLPVRWPSMSSNDSYLFFQDPLNVRMNYLKEDCDFWDSIGYKSSF